MHFLFPNAQVSMCNQYGSRFHGQQGSYFAGMFIHIEATIVVINVELITCTQNGTARLTYHFHSGKWMILQDEV